MTQIQKESGQTKPLFDQAVTGIAEVIKAGTVVDPDYTAVLMKVFNGHIKLRNVEIRESALRYQVAKDLNDNVEALKTALKNQLPEYVSER